MVRAFLAPLEIAACITLIAVSIAWVTTVRRLARRAKVATWESGDPVHWSAVDLWSDPPPPKRRRIASSH